mgnify:CR=1 FL=1
MNRLFFLFTVLALTGLLWIGCSRKEAPAPKAKKESGAGPNLALTLLVLFSPLLAVQAVSFQTFARIAKQSAGK